MGLERSPMTSTDALRRDLQTAYARHLDLRARRRRLARVAVVACATSLVVVGAGFAAVDRGLPADLRLNPDVEHASAVAATATATLYAASLQGGGSCTEIVTAGDRGRGARCTTA